MPKSVFSFAVAASVLSLGLFASPVTAQTVLGRSVVNGEAVELLSDKTWRFLSTEQTDNCHSYQQGLSFCDGEKSWQRTDFTSPDVAAQYRYDDRHYGQYVIEALGSKDGITDTFMRNAVIENAAAASGVAPNQIPVLDVSSDEIGGHSAATIKYLTDIEGLSIVFFNSIVVLDRRSFQVITYSVNEGITDEHLQLHSEFLSKTSIN